MKPTILFDVEFQKEIYFPCTKVEIFTTYKQQALDEILSANAGQWVLFKDIHENIIELGYRPESVKRFLNPDDYKKWSDFEEDKRMGRVPYGTKFILK